MSRRAYTVFLLLTLGWIGGAIRLYGDAYAFSLVETLTWWTLLVMLVATGTYAILDAPAARVSGWLRRDLAVNALLALALLFALLDGAHGFRRLGVDGAGWLAFGVAALHPVLVDWPHRRHHVEDPAGSPVPGYVPVPCVAIDWTLAAFLLLGLIVL